MSASVACESFFSANVPGELWHYTTLGGLKGILSSGTIFATEAHYTKDKQEFVHARDVAVAYLSKVRAVDEESAFTLKQADQLVEHAFTKGYLSQEVSEVFVASFSAAADSKSQWFEFAEQGRGVSICFDLRHIRPPSELEIAVTVAPCVYDQQAKESLVGAALSTFLQTTTAMMKLSSDVTYVNREMTKAKYISGIHGEDFSVEKFKAEMMAKLTEVLGESDKRTKYDLLRVASHCKHVSFEQENEWRLALPHLRGNPWIDSKLEYRNGAPYVATRLFQPTPKLPVTSVMLGPLCTSEADVTDILSSTGYDIPIRCSQIPLR